MFGWDSIVMEGASDGVRLRYLDDRVLILQPLVRVKDDVALEDAS
jgi:hypothetical protein